MFIEINGCIKNGVKIGYRPKDVILFCACLLERFVAKFVGTRIVFLFHIPSNIPAASDFHPVNNPDCTLTGCPTTP